MQFSIKTFWSTLLQSCHVPSCSEAAAWQWRPPAQIAVGGQMLGREKLHQGVARVWFGKQNTNTQQHLKPFLELEQTIYKWSEKSNLIFDLNLWNQDEDIVDLGHCECRAPILLQDVQTNLSLGRIQDKFPSKTQQVDLAAQLTHFFFSTLELMLQW